MLNGIDVHDGQGVVAWATVALHNQFAFVRAAYGHRAKAPVAPKELVAHIVESCGLNCSKHTLHMVKVRVTRALDYLRKTEIAVVAMVPGMRKYRWALSEREREFWPEGIKKRIENFADSDKTMSLLGRATKPLTVTEIAEQIVIGHGEIPRSKRLNQVGQRVRACLHFYREQGTVLQMSQHGSRTTSWLLASRKQELLPSETFDADGRIQRDARVLSILGSASGPMTAPQIAAAWIALTKEPRTERNLKLTIDRVRAHLRRFFEAGLVREIRIQGSRFGGWVLTDKARRELAA